MTIAGEKKIGTVTNFPEPGTPLPGGTRKFVTVPIFWAAA